MPVSLNGHALEEFQAAPKELKIWLANHPEPTLRAFFEHMDRAMGVIRNNRAERNDFESFVQKENETFREFARRVRSMGSLVFTNLEMDERKELLRDRFLEGLRDPELLEKLLLEEARNFAKTVHRAVDLEGIAIFM